MFELEEAERCEESDPFERFRGLISLLKTLPEAARQKEASTCARSRIDFRKASESLLSLPPLEGPP